MKLPTRISKIIKIRLSDLFDKVKDKLLGRAFPQDLSLTMIGMYSAAVQDEGGIPSLETLEAIKDTSNNYLEALKLQTTNKIVKEIEKHLNNDPKATQETILKTLQEAWKGVTAHLESIVVSETQAAKNIGSLQGIIRKSSYLGIEKPVVFFIVKLDEFTCESCIEVHLMPDKATPRLYYLSELNHGYAKKNDGIPSIFGRHPNCRMHIKQFASRVWI